MVSFSFTLFSITHLEYLFLQLHIQNVCPVLLPQTLGYILNFLFSKYIKYNKCMSDKSISYVDYSVLPSAWIHPMCQTCFWIVLINGCQSISQIICNPWSQLDTPYLRNLDLVKLHLASGRIQDIRSGVFWFRKSGNCYFAKIPNCSLWTFLPQNLAVS